jgi:hypothetical protein
MDEFWEKYFERWFLIFGLAIFSLVLKEVEEMMGIN